MKHDLTSAETQESLYGLKLFEKTINRNSSNLT